MNSARPAAAGQAGAAAGEAPAVGPSVCLVFKKMHELLSFATSGVPQQSVVR